MTKRKKNGIISKSTLPLSKERKMEKKVLKTELKDRFNLTERQLEKMLIDSKKPKKKVIKINKPAKTFKIAVVTDTHLCSTKCAFGELESFYKIVKERGIDTVLHAGDLVAGNGKMFRGQLSEMTHYGFQAQKDFAIENYPRVSGITTFVVAGNHDLSFFNDNGADIVEEISQQRSDIKYLGHYGATFTINGIKIELLHPDKGGSYALSYSSQRIIEQLESGTKPHVYIFGHWHTAVYYHHRGVHVLHGGAWEHQSLYLKRKGINPSIGGWILTISTDNKGNVISFLPEFLKF